jgi:phosphatidylserine decarboxylase
MRVAKEGYPFILTSALLFLLSLLAGWTWIELLLILVTFVFVGFFRDPERVPPGGEGLIVSPADGKVVGIKDIGKEELSDPATRVSIFLSPLDVHVNRSPVTGHVEEVHYQKGNFLAAYKDEASQKNERNALRIVDPEGRKINVVQIAGVIARRIVCYVKIGDSLERGQRLGLIMFGSRVDLFLPEGSRVEVLEGQRVKGGETIIGRFP